MLQPPWATKRRRRVSKFILRDRRRFAHEAPYRPASCVPCSCGNLTQMAPAFFCRFVLVSSLVLGGVACQSQPAPEPAKAGPAPTVTHAPTPAPTPAGKLVLGAPIGDGAGQKTTLSAVAAAPGSFADKKLVMDGTITAVCQHMGCWMELKDASGEAHVKMAGHAFFVPKTASGKKARVLGKLVGTPAGASCGEGEGKEKGMGCKAEAEKQLGRPLAKLELEAEGVEILD